MELLDNLSYFRELNDNLDVLVEHNHDLFEYEQNVTPPTLKGRLKAHLPYWESIYANRFIIDTIRFGYRIPFIENPIRVLLVNNKSALEHSEFVETAITELVQNCAVVEVPFIPHIVNPLSVSIQSSGKKRLILNLRHVNQCVWKETNKFEDWRVLSTYVTKGGFLFNFDLKSGYHHIDIFPEHQTYLGFSWNIQGIPKYFCFTVLPFGLSSAPYIFTKVLRPLVKFWRFNGVRIVVYLDDGCGSSDSVELIAKGHAQFVRYSLRDAGFVVNSSKSGWEPVHSLIWLGLEWNLNSGCFSITRSRIDKFLQIVDRFLTSAPYVTARDCATVAGHIMSMSPVIGHLIRLKTRYLYKVIEARCSWNSRFNIGVYNDALAEIFFWKNNVINLNLKRLVDYSIPMILSYSDASNVACGAFIDGTNAVCHRMWSESEARKSSTWRELKAIHFSLLAFRSLISDKSIKWHSDSQAAVRILEVGSPKSELHT